MAVLTLINEVKPKKSALFITSSEQIIKTHPDYLTLLKVKPGITSMGMVKFGYAEDVTEMIERMQYDLYYLNNISLLLDIKIMLQSVIVILGGKGK